MNSGSTKMSHFTRSVALSGLLLASAAQADVCVSNTLDVYSAAGFTCTIGSLEFSNFHWSSNILVNDQYGTAHSPDAIWLTPQDGGNVLGFNISNLGLSFFGGLSNRTSGVSFDVAALTGVINGASLSIGTHSRSGEGVVSSWFADAGGSFSFGAFDPGQQTDSSSFADVSSLQTYSGVSAIVTGFGGGMSSVDDYTVLLSVPDESSSTTVPEPSSIALIAAGLLAAYTVSRRKV